MSVSSALNGASHKPCISVASADPTNANTSANGQPTSGGDHNGGNTVHNGDSVRSPTSVTMVCSSSSASLLPTAAATTISKSAAVVPKPFFVMDWLEEINPRDLELARQKLNTPTKRGLQSQGERSKSTPSFRQSQAASSPPSCSSQQPSLQTRSSINLPTLTHKEEESICRQLYPAAEPSSPSNPNVADDDQEPPSSQSISRATSATSASTAGSSVAATTPKQTRANSNMSPFKKRSIAIGNGWNAKGLQKAKKGSWESAFACWKNALEIRSQVLGETHPDVANTCNNIGIALGKLERYDEAIEILERALELRAKHYGTREHVEVAATLHNIGNVLHAAKDCAGAIQCFWDAKLLQEQLLGHNHVQVARACVAIANVYYEAHQYEDAREAYHDALQVFANAGLSERHPEILAIQQDLRDIETICCRAQVQQH